MVGVRTVLGDRPLLEKDREEMSKPDISTGRHQNSENRTPHGKTTAKTLCQLRAFNRSLYSQRRQYWISGECMKWKPTEVVVTDVPAEENIVHASKVVIFSHVFQTSVDIRSDEPQRTFQR